jgi:hypothetical protein
MPVRVIKELEMGEKDKEAFEEWYIKTDTIPVINNLTGPRTYNYFTLEQTWQAACEYKQSQVQFTKDANKTLQAKVTCLNQVNDGLHRLLKEEEERAKILIEALEFYANSTRLMLDVKDLPIDPVLGRSVISSQSIMDNGDRARFALNKYRESSND